jgi:hypothetical protein
MAKFECSKIFTLSIFRNFPFFCFGADRLIAFLFGILPVTLLIILNGRLINTTAYSIICHFASEIGCCNWLFEA